MKTDDDIIPDINQLLDCCPGNKENFNYLISLIQKHVVVPFVGAGFSQNYGYPGWTDFLKKQAKCFQLPEINEKLKEKDYEGAASILNKHLEKHMMEYVMIQEFGDHIYKNAPDNSDLEILPRLFRNLIITTNFDEVLEMLYAKVNGEMIRILTPQKIQNEEQTARQIARGDAMLVKMHGDARDGEYVLTKEEYDKAYGEGELDMKRPLPAFLRKILLSRILLFLGCSLEEDRTLDVIKHVRGEGNLSFALVMLPESTANKDEPWKPRLFYEEDGKCVENEDFHKRRHMLEKSNIAPIWYPFGQHEALPLILREISYQVKGVYIPSITQLHTRLNRLLNYENEDPDTVYRQYTEAEELLWQNEGFFQDADKLKILKKMKIFYGPHGWICERKKVMKDILRLTKRIFGKNSLETAMAYHDLGYTYERYHYYKLMLYAMLRTEKILNHFENENARMLADENSSMMRNLVNARIVVDISLGYAYLKNNDTDHAKIFYEKAKNLYEQEDKMKLLNRSETAFFFNGLYRYYCIQNDPEKALKVLDQALEIRQELTRGEDEQLTQHIVNTHSNKIRVFLSMADSARIKKAQEEYLAFENEPHIQTRIKNLPEARQRILTDYGDILRADKQYLKAVSQYQNALEVRRYLHFEDDFAACELYLKIADCLREISENRDEALEYIIQAYMVSESLLGFKHEKTKKIWSQILNQGVQLKYSQESLEQRVKAQRVVRNYRYDHRMREREDKLIQYFELI